MLLDKEFFNSISLQPEKKKYFNMSEVNSLLVDIRSRAQQTEEEIDSLSSKLEKSEASAELFRTKAEEYRIKGQALSKEVLSLRARLGIETPGIEAGPTPDELLVEARRQADEIISRARQEADEILALARHNADQITSDAIDRSRDMDADSAVRAEAIISRANTRSEEILSASSVQQAFVVERVESLISSMKELHESAIEDLNSQWQEFLIAIAGEDSAPPDLGEKIGRIADTLSEINDL